MVNFFEALRDGLHFNKFSLSDLLCVEYTCPLEEEEIEIWAQSDYIIHVLSGKKSWRTAHGTFEVVKGDTVYIRKGAAFIKQFFNDDFCMLAFFVTDDLIRDALKDVKRELKRDNNENLDFSVFFIKDSKLLQSFFHGMLHHFHEEEKPLDTLLELKFKELIISMALESKNQQLTNYFIEVSSSSLPSLPSVMEQNYTFNLSLEEFARLCGRSLSSFKRDFADYYTESPGRWLLTKRLERAAAMLKDDSLNIAEVAYQCGFKDNSHFGRSFKLKFGKTPVEFRAELAT